MKKSEPANMLLYRWRYFIGYAALVMAFVLAITLSVLYAPGGITQAEIDTIAKTTEFAQDPESNLTNFPFHGLQLLGFKMLGVSILSIKLPAMVLSVGSIVAIFFLLRRWFKANITILSMLIMAATGQLIFLAQSATPNILYVVYSALILLFSSLILQKASRPLLWKLLLMATVAISMYTPYFIYINIGLLIAATIHPRTRYHLLRKAERKNWLISGAAFLVLIAPAAYASINDVPFLRNLIGIDQAISADITTNLQTLPKIYFWLEPNIVNNQIAPIFDFTSIFIIILGALALFRQSYTARSYVITAWLALTIPIIIVEPGLAAAMIVPLFILLTIGIETLLNEWYKLFPKNPYARGFGLVLTVSLISVMIFSGIDRFANGYRHMPEAVNLFSTDIRLLRNHISKYPARTEVIASDNEAPLYAAYARYSRPDLIVGSVGKNLESTNILVTRQAKDDFDAQKLKLIKIVTNDRLEQADRFYLYKAD